MFPNYGVLGCAGNTLHLGMLESGILVTFNLDVLSVEMAVYLTAIGSIILRLMDHSLSHSIFTSAFEGPYSNINSISVSTLIPLLNIPLIVGNLGSSHPSTLPVSTNHLSFLLENTVFTILNLENPRI